MITFITCLCNITSARHTHRAVYVHIGTRVILHIFIQHKCWPGALCGLFCILCPTLWIYLFD